MTSMNMGMAIKNALSLEMERDPDLPRRGNRGGGLMPLRERQR